MTMVLRLRMGTERKERADPTVLANELDMG